MKLSKPLLVVMVATGLLGGCTQAQSNNQGKSENNSGARYTITTTDKRLQSTLGTDDRLKVLDQAILYNYWHKPNFKETQKAGVTEKSNFAVMEALYKRALSVDPLNTKYLLGLASVSQSQGKMSQAEDAWKQTIKVDPDNFDAILSLAAYAQFSKNNTAFINSMERLKKLDAAKAARIQTTFTAVKKAETMKLNHNLSQYKTHSDNHFIVQLGFVLDEKGHIQPTLLQRLRTTLALAKKDKSAKILVSGGKLPQEPKVEANVMKKWLVKHGIKSNRILTEDRSLDTVENAINSTSILRQHKASSVTLVSSASHMRRAYTLFKLAEKLTFVDKAPVYKLDNFVAVDNNKFLKPISKDSSDVQKIITDSLRINDFWILPGIQR